MLDEPKQISGHRVASLTPLNVKLNRHSILIDLNELISDTWEACRNPT